MIVTAAIIAKNGKILIAKRKMGKWEFPGGRIEAGENLEECLISGTRISLIILNL